jgi:hypothetical protein
VLTAAYAPLRQAEAAFVGHARSPGGVDALLRVKRAAAIRYRCPAAAHRDPRAGDGPLTPPPLIRSSLAEIRRVLARTLLAATDSIDHILGWPL